MVVIEIFDILIITEKKLDKTFPTSQFYIEGFSKPIGWIRIGMVVEYLSMSEKAFRLKS